jgi:Mannan-binding protein
MKKLVGSLVAVVAATALVQTVAATSRALPPPAADGVDVPAGPIWNNDDARTKCPAVCTAAGGSWNGHWRTVIPGRSSVCGCN